MSKREEKAAKLPTLGSVVFAALDLTADQVAFIGEMHRRLGADPAAFEAWVEKFISSRLNAAVIMRFVAEAKSEVVELFTKGSGPVTHDPVDTA